MDLDAYVAAHAPEWRRLERLVARRRLSGAEADELVGLYQRVATHLSVIQTRSPDPALVGRLSTLVARARSAVAGSSAPAWRDLARFFRVTFPVAVFRGWRWWCGVGVLATAVSFALLAWVGSQPRVRGQLLAPEAARQLCQHDFATYYSEGAAGSFAAQVWTNNALVAAGTLVTGVLIAPALYILLVNAVNVGITGGFLVGCGQSAQFFGLIAPHGILELTAVYVAAGVGLRIGWTWIDPGNRPRGRALAEETRAAATVALGLVLVLAVSGAIEAFVTPSPLPTWARVGIGVLAEAAFLGYIMGYGGRAARRGETGDLELGRREDVEPVA